MTVSREYLEFLAHSLELETEAGERYGELADALAAHHNQDVAAFLYRMAEEATLHRAEVAALASDAELPRAPAWEFDWPDAEAPETASYEAVHYRMGLREAMQLALCNEESAQAWYAAVAGRSGDPLTAETARRFAAEEGEHAAALRRMLAQLPPEPQHLREDDDPPHEPD